jgi:hypothetical protein
LRDPLAHVMASIATALRAWRKFIAGAILFAGTAAALAIYLTATPPPENPLGYRPEDTKQYLRQMEVYGGKANVLASELREWFVGLWHGKTFAFTVLVISVLLALGFLIATTPLPGAPDSAETGRPDPNRPRS